VKRLRHYNCVIDGCDPHADAGKSLRCIYNFDPANRKTGGGVVYGFAPVEKAAD